MGAEVVPPSDVFDTMCDVYAPCAVGATLHQESIPRLRCAVVAGAANNQLREPEDAQRLLERQILFAPDYVINGGGAMAFTTIYQGEERIEELERRVRGIGAALDGIFAESAAAGSSPVVAARALADRVLARGPRSG